MLIQSNTPKDVTPADKRSAGNWNGRLAGLGVVDWLMLAATPIFATMALLTAFDRGAEMICSSMGASPLSGMAPMYALMSLFHTPAWFRLIAGARLKAERTSPDRTRSALEGLWLS
jgi:hypothetical protein